MTQQPVALAVASLQKQVQVAEAKAAAKEQTAAALQQDVASWQARCKRRDADLAALAGKVTSGVLPMDSLRQTRDWVLIAGSEALLPCLLSVHWTCMCAYMHEYACVCVCVCVLVYLRACVCTCISVCVCVCLHATVVYSVQHCPS